MKTAHDVSLRHLCILIGIVAAPGVSLACIGLAIAILQSDAQASGADVAIEAISALQVTGVARGDHSGWCFEPLFFTGASLETLLLALRFGRRRGIIIVIRAAVSWLISIRTSDPG